MTLWSIATCRTWSAGLGLSGLIVAGAGDAVADPDWTGFYVGAFAGGAWGNTDLHTDTGTVNASTYFESNANANAVSSNASGSTSSKAFAGGVQFGANQRIDQIIVGAELDYGSFNLSGSRGATAVAYPTTAAHIRVESSVGTDWLSRRAGVSDGWRHRECCYTSRAASRSPNSMSQIRSLTRPHAGNWQFEQQQDESRVDDRRRVGMGRGRPMVHQGRVSIRGLRLRLDLNDSGMRGPRRMCGRGQQPI